MRYRFSTFSIFKAKASDLTCSVAILHQCIVYEVIKSFLHRLMKEQDLSHIIKSANTKCNIQLVEIHACNVPATKKCWMSFLQIGLMVFPLKVKDQK